MQFTIVVSALLSVAGFAVATPPACIISAIGVQGSDATDMKALCDTKQDYVLGNMTESCSSSNIEAAYDYYSSTCLEEAQITVSALPSDASGSSDSDSDSGSGSSSNSDDESDNSVESDDKENAATPAVGGTSKLLLAVSGLLATGMTGVLLL